MTDTRPQAATPPTPEVIEAEIGKIALLIAGAGRLLGENKQVDLSALETRVETLCGTLNGLPDGSAPRLKPQLENVLLALDALEKELSREHESLSSLLEGEDRRKGMEAARSYGRASGGPSSVPSGTDTDKNDD